MLLMNRKIIIIADIGTGRTGRNAQQHLYGIWQYIQKCLYILSIKTFDKTNIVIKVACTTIFPLDII